MAKANLILPWSSLGEIGYWMEVWNIKVAAIKEGRGLTPSTIRARWSAREQNCMEWILGYPGGSDPLMEEVLSKTLVKLEMYPIYFSIN